MFCVVKSIRAPPDDMMDSHYSTSICPPPPPPSGSVGPSANMLGINECQICKQPSHLAACPVHMTICLRSTTTAAVAAHFSSSLHVVVIGGPMQISKICGDTIQTKRENTISSSFVPSAMMNGHCDACARFFVSNPGTMYLPHLKCTIDSSSATEFLHFVPLE